MKIKKSENNKNEKLIEIFKLLSFIILFLAIFLQLETLLFFLLKNILKNIILIILIFIIYHYLLFHYIIESFLFLLQFPFLGKTSSKINGSILARELITYLSTFIDICEKVVDNDKEISSNEYVNILDIYERINLMIYIFYEMKKRYGLSKYQKDFYDALIIWRKHFNQFKVIQFFKENKKILGPSCNILFSKNLVILILDSNFIIKICDDYICNNYHFLSFKKIYNHICNDTFCSENQYKTEFSLKFKEQYNKFITKDNKEIDYVIIDGKKITNLINENVNINIKSNKQNKNNINNSINDPNESIITTSSYISEINNEEDSHYYNYIKKTKNNKRNIIIFCNPNSMIYQFFSTEKYYFYYEGGCDILFWNYRGYGQSDGFSNFDNIKSDVIELYDEIKKLNKYNKIGVHGYSIGGIPATHLAKNRNIDLLVSDRNFTNLGNIAQAYSCGSLLKFFCKLFWVDRYSNDINYMYPKNNACVKIILCDPLDEVVLNNGSIKSSISRYILYKNNKKENILDILLDDNEKDKFIDSLLNIEFFIEKNQAFPNNFFIGNINKFFECFSFGSEDMINYCLYFSKRLKVLCINNFFNNFFIWGTRLNEENKEKNIYYNINNNMLYINKAIDILGSLEKMKSNLSELNNKEFIMDDVNNIKKVIIGMKNNIEKIKINDDINKGYLIRLSCGHNVILKGKDEKTLVTILEKENFFEKKQKDI